MNRLLPAHRGAGPFGHRYFCPLGYGYVLTECVFLRKTTDAMWNLFLVGLHR